MVPGCTASCYQLILDNKYTISKRGPHQVGLINISSNQIET